jgi:hypothetical protein
MYSIQKNGAMRTNYSTSNTSKTIQPKHTEWMRNLPENLHNESITKIAIPGRRTFWQLTRLADIICLGTHDSFAFHLTHQPGPDMATTLRRFRYIIYPIIKKWSITQNKTFIGMEILLKRSILFISFD